MTATSSNGHIETLGNWLHRKPVPVQSATMLRRSLDAKCLHAIDIHIYKCTYIYIYFMVWSRCKYAIVANMTLYHQILQMIAYRLFYVGRVSSRCGEYADYKFSKSSRFFNRAIVTDCNKADLSGILKYFSNRDRGRDIIASRIEKKYFHKLSGLIQDGS